MTDNGYAAMGDGWSVVRYADTSEVVVTSAANRMSGREATALADAIAAAVFTGERRSDPEQPYGGLRI